MTTRRWWTEAEDAAILAAIADGGVIEAAAGKLAAQFGRTRKAVLVHASKLRHAAGQACRFRWTIEDDARLAALREEGMSHAAIAEAMGRPVGGVTNRVYMLALKKRAQSEAEAERTYVDLAAKGRETTAAERIAKIRATNDRLTRAAHMRAIGVGGVA